MTAGARRTTLRDEARRELLTQWFAESASAPGNYLGIPLCEIRWDRGCTGRATQGHEPLMRSRGGDILDREQVLLTCWYCHRKVHDNVAEATERGFLVSRYVQ